MPITLIDKIKPKNNGGFPLVDAEDVLMPDGVTRLSEYKFDSGDDAEVAVLEEQNVPGFAYDSQFGYCLIMNPAPFNLVLGAQYRVMWDGTEYDCTAHDGSAVLPGAVYIGNGSAFNLASNGEPFAILCVSGVGVCSALSDAAASHRVGIYAKTTYATIDDVAAYVNGLFVSMTQAEYDALVAAGTVDANKYYMIVGDSE